MKKDIKNLHQFKNVVHGGDWRNYRRKTGKEKDWTLQWERL